MMKRSVIFVRVLILLSMLLGLVTTTPVQTVLASPANETNGEAVSPEAYLNPDGTLNLDENFSGTFDLDGWNVQLDPKAGPVFSPVAALDNWDTIGTGSGPLNDAVSSIVADGGDIYIGGWFRDVDGILAADYIAKWDGAQWAALASNGSGDGAISNGVRGIEILCWKPLCCR
ncbi:MAG: hypothetical protein IPN96_14805 [Anaerolineales bacterium]|nr:hypothetical protein [Anaerolineales bacterium]